MTNPEDQETSGSALRDQMVGWRTVAVNAAVAQSSYLRPSDFDGVAPDQIGERATEIIATRKAEADSLLRQALVDRGVAETDLEKALSSFGSGDQPAPKVDNTAARLASVGQLGGSPVKPRVVVPETAIDKINAGIAANPVR